MYSNAKDAWKAVKSLAVEAQELARVGMVTEAESKSSEMNSAMSAAQSLEAAENALKMVSGSSDPVELPIDGDAPAGAVKDVGAAYVMRFGDENTASQQVLADLYGKNYKGMRMAQWTAFKGYLRNYHHEPDGDARKLLKQIILTPELAMTAVKEDVSVKYLKDMMVESVDTLGGYVVPVDFQTEVIKRVQGISVMRKRARLSQTSRDRVEIPKLTGGDDQYTGNVRVTWVDETPTEGTADTNLTFGMEAVDIHTVMAETFLSRNVVDDSATNLIMELTEAFGEAAGIDEDNQFLIGNGVGKPHGLLKGGTTPMTGIEVVNSGSAADITWDGLIALTYGIAAQYRSNAVWIAERATVKKIRQQKDGTGRYLWEPNQQSGQPDELMGYPFLEQEIMPSIGANTYPILFGDPRGYRIVDRLGMTVERYLDSATARKNAVVYIMRRRLGGKLTDPWRWAVQKCAA